LHLCAVSGITVVDYVDHAEGFLEEGEDGQVISTRWFCSLKLHWLRAGLKGDREKR